MTIQEFYNSNVKTWLDDLTDGVRDGTTEDPHLVPISVEPASIHWQRKVVNRRDSSDE
jgi:hypothetical protein